MLFRLLLLSFALCTAPVAVADRPTVATVNGNTGRGVLVSRGDRVIFLTARHVATYEGCFRGVIDFTYELSGGRTEKRRILDGEKRWLTHEKPEIDLAWIALKPEELPEKSEYSCVNFDDITTNSLVAAMKKRLLVASYQDKTADFLMFLNAEISFKGNTCLQTHKQKVGLLNIGVCASESGSPVFMIQGHETVYKLIGILTVGSTTIGESGFLALADPTTDILKTILDSFKGGSGLRLCDRRDLW